MKNKAFLFKTLFVSAFMLVLLSLTVFAAEHGDVDKNGILQASDARLTLRMSVGLEPAVPGSEAFLAADINFDGKLTASDARTILRASVGLDELSHKFGDKFSPEKKQSGINMVVTGKHYQECSCGLKKYSFCSYGDRVYKDGTKATCIKSARYGQLCSVCKGTRETVEKALGHSFAVVESKEATCKEAGYVKYKCTRSGCGMTTENTLFQIRHEAIASSKTFKVNCPVCGKKVDSTFNMLVNPLKTSPHTFISFEKEEAASSLGKHNIEINPIVKAFPGGDKLESEFYASFTGEPTTKYGSYRSNTTVKQDTFPIYGKTDVSLLTDSDIKDLKVTYDLTSIDFINEFDSSEMSSSYIKTFVNYIKTTNNFNVYKVEVTIPTERYSKVLADKVTETALMRIQGTDIIEYAQADPVLGDLGLDGMDMEDMEGADFNIDMAIKDAESNFRATYYFDTETNAPVAAVYKLDFSTDAKTNMSFSMDLGDGVPLWILRGDMEITLDDSATTYYFFDNHFFK